MLAAAGGREHAARTLLAVLVAGLVGVTAGVLWLVSVLAVERRRAALVLLRRRGASSLRLAALVGTQAAAAAIPGAVVGYLVGMHVPGRSGPGYLVLPGALTLGAVALMVLAGARVHGGRQRRVARFRWVGELVVLAATGFALTVTSGSDPLLVALPLLVGLSAAIVALRVYPWPARLALRASGGRDLGFLPRPRAGRAPAGGRARPSPRPDARAGDGRPRHDHRRHGPAGHRDLRDQGGGRRPETRPRLEPQRWRAERRAGRGGPRRTRCGRGRDGRRRGHRDAAPGTWTTGRPPARRGRRGARGGAGGPSRGAHGPDLRRHVRGGHARTAVRCGDPRRAARQARADGADRRRRARSHAREHSGWSSTARRGQRSAARHPSTGCSSASTRARIRTPSRRRSPPRRTPRCW